MQHKPYIFHAKEVMCDYAYRLIDVYKQGTLNQITNRLQLLIATFFLPNFLQSLFINCFIASYIMDKQMVFFGNIDTVL